MGIDDASFERTEPGEPGASVGVAGVVCEETAFEGMVWDQITEDGWDATDVIVGRIQSSKFASQIHAVLLDGIAFGGFNVVDLPAMAERLGIPCCTVIRNEPDWSSIRSALDHLRGAEERWRRMRRAGSVVAVRDVYMQICGEAPVELWRRAMPGLTGEGALPEAVRFAHLIATAVATGESGRRA